MSNNNNNNNVATAQEPLFVNIDPDNPVTEIPSLCMNCEKEGMTRLLLTKIPHFKEIIVMAFDCPHCGLQNSEVQSAGTIQEKGSIQSCTISTKEDLNRQIVKSEHASVTFKELEFEIPANTAKGVLTTIQGLVDRAVEGLTSDQPVRKHVQPEMYEKIQKVIDTLTAYYEGEAPFTVVVDDPSGNSYVENLCIPNADPKLSMKYYTRTREQNEALGLAHPDEEEKPAEEEPQNDDPNFIPDEVHTFPALCSSCSAPSLTKMHLLDIPHFKEVVIMSTTCDSCGYKSNEVKAGGPISQKGRRIILNITDAEDLSRDILKSETCGLRIPEVDLELNPGTLGGRFTTLEGLLTQVYEELEQRTPFISASDSATGESKSRFTRFLEKLKSVIELTSPPYTVILDDPLANSYLQNLYAPDPDPNMTIEEYERSWEQNEVLGLNDMVVEGYETIEEEGEGKSEEAN